jgi:hypothetical protein
MGQTGDGVTYEKTNPSESCTCSDAGLRSADRPGGGSRQDTASASPVSRSGREVARCRTSLDERLLAVGPRTQGEKRIRLGAGQVETPAAFRRRVGFAKLARKSWRLHFRWGPLALTNRRILDRLAHRLSCA